MSFVDPSLFTTRPEIQGTFGVVASTHWIATAVGMGMLERGGNAFDAGVATAFALQIVEPHLNGPGGDVSIMVHDAKRGRTQVICGQGPAPAGATMAHFRELGLNLIPGTGLLAPCVPGCFDSFMLLLRDYGTVSLAEALGPAIGYAQQGHPLVERASATIATVRDHFLAHWPTSAALWLDKGEVPAPGVMFSNPTLAKTYSRVLREAAGPGGREAEIERARKIWAQGFVAEAIEKFCRTEEVMDVSGRAHGGLLTGADMAAWSATIEEPIGYDYGRYRVLKPSPWSQGLAALQQLALLKGLPFNGLDPTGPDFIHWQVEAAKLAFADRDTFYGDPDFAAVPTDVLLSNAYNDKRRALIGPAASLDQRPGVIPGHGMALAARTAGGGPRSRGIGRVWRTDGGPRWRIARRHGALRHHRPARQHDRRDSFGRLAAVVPNNSGAGLLPRLSRADVCARGGPPGKPCTRQAPALDAVAHNGPARWRALSRVGNARGRPAGPVDSAILPPARPCRIESSGIDRRARVAYRALSVFVLAAHGAPRSLGRGKPHAGINDR
jgi:gamma-glutamyltranspeptidase / glutathione hydrolase